MSRYSGRGHEPVKSQWSVPVQMGHLCFPPEGYPTGCGPESEWTCLCGNVWVSEGRKVLSEWPKGPSRNDVIMGPERWVPKPGECHPQHGEAEMYDWRPLGSYYVALLRKLIELNGGRWDDITS